MGSSYFIDGKLIPVDGSGNYSNLSEFDWTLGFNRTLGNVESAWIEEDGDHFIGGTSLVVKGEDVEPVTTITLQEFETNEGAGPCKLEVVYKTEGDCL